MNEYVGNPLQIRGAEQYVLQNGKGDGMHFLYIRNGLGLEVWVSLDRCGDISRVTFKGDNMGYFSPCGYVAPHYFDDKGKGFLKSFTIGFFTTCGLSAVGSPCVDEGEELGLHGTVSSIPSELCGIDERNEGLIIKLKIRDAVLFGRKLVMNREYRFSYTENSIELNDTVVNEADTTTPYMILYHCNMGYPLLSENSIVIIPYNSFCARDKQAEKSIQTALLMEKPQAQYKECCYYYDVKEKDKKAKVGIFNGMIEKGLVMEYNKETLPCFTEWKMMGKIDYVLGLEPGNCTPDGRDIMRKQGKLKFLESGESALTSVKFNFLTNVDNFEKEFNR